MDPEKFYDDLWQAEDRGSRHPTAQRDWFHRFVLDPIFDPTANPRPEVSVSLLQGGQRLLDVGCWDGGFLERVRRAGLYTELCGVVGSYRCMGRQLVFLHQGRILNVSYYFLIAVNL